MTTKYIAIGLASVGVAFMIALGTQDAIHKYYTGKAKITELELQKAQVELQTAQIKARYPMGTTNLTLNSRTKPSTLETN